MSRRHVADGRDAAARRARRPRRAGRVPRTLAVALAAVLAVTTLLPSAAIADATDGPSPSPSAASTEMPAPTPAPEPAPAPAPTPGASDPAPSPAPAPTPTTTPAPGDDAVDQPVADDKSDGADEPVATGPFENDKPVDEPSETLDASAETPDTTAPDPSEPRAPPRVGARLLAGVGILAAGVPDGPAEVWTETFEQGLNTTTPSGLAGYVSGRYTGSAGWTTGTNCTGVLVNYTATYPNASFCPSEAIVIGVGGNNTVGARETRRMADVLGQVAAGVAGGTTAAAPVAGSTNATRANHALTAAPYAAIAAGNTVVLQSSTGIGVTASSAGFYAMRVDALGDECGTNNASLTFALVSGGTTYSPFPAAIVPCAAGGYYTSTPLLAATGGGLDGNATVQVLTASARAATYTGISPVLLTPAQLAAAQVRVTNTVTAAAGNAFAVDNIRLLDVTPALDMAFSPSPAVAGTATTLTYTITNRSDLLAKTDWGFTATLPSGLLVAPTPAIGGTCTNVGGTTYAVTAAAGAGSVQVVGGDLASGATSCTISVSVVAAAAGTYSSGSVAPAGLIASPAASVTVAPASTLTVRKNITARTTSTDQFTLSLRSGSTVLASATTTGTATGIQAVQISRFTVSPSTTYTVHETPTAGAGLGYASSYECVRDGTVVAAGASRSGTITMPADQGAEVVCTFTNAPQTAQLACDSNRFYAVTSAGALLQGDIVSGAQSNVGTWANVTGANALGVAATGSLAYAVNRSTDGTTALAMLKWSAAGGFETIANTAYTPVNAAGTAVAGSLTSGAVDLTNGRYLFGKFDGGLFHLWSFTESNPAATRYAYLGSFTTGSAPNGNGDMAFDSRGNLYVLGAATVNNAASAAIFTVSSSALASANGGTLTVSTSQTRALTGLDSTPAFGNVNGIAFSPRGTAYLSSNTSTYEFDPTSWTRIAGSPRIDMAATDLATCTSPGTVSVLKNVVGRLAAADQFQLTLADPTGTVATAATTGAATGRQPVQLGPFPVRTGTALTVSEAMATGSASAITAYTIVFECWSDGIRLANGTSPTGTLTMPERFGANVVCTFFNSPRPASTVTITKRVLDPVTGQSQPAAGWSVGTAAVATAGTVTVVPGEAPRQDTDATGSASWSVLFGSVASRATLTISEVQQARFTFVSASCTVNGTGVAVTFTTSGGIVSGSIPNVASASVVACTLINQPVTSLTLVKRVDYGSAVPSDWLLSAAGPAGSLPGPSGRSGTAAVGVVPVTPGVAYRLAESGGPSLYIQTGPWTCVNAAGQAVSVTPAGDVTLTTGANVTCTVANATASLIVLVQVISPQPGFQAPDWTVTATPGAFAGGTLPTASRPGTDPAGNQSAAVIDVRPGQSYTLTEAPAAVGSRLAYAQQLQRQVGTGWVDVTSATITAPAAGQTAVYRFVNTRVQPTVLPLTGGLGADGFLFAGGGVLALALILAVLHGRRTRRSTA